MAKILRGVFTIFLLFLMLYPASVYAAGTYTATFPDVAEAGDEIRVSVSVPAGQTLTTLGLNLDYDATILTYKKDEWHTNENDQLRLVSDVTSENGRTLHISFIDAGGYTPEGNLVTLVFDVKQGYSESPVQLSFRDATDAEEKSIQGDVATIVESEEGSQKPVDNGGVPGNVEEPVEEPTEKKDETMSSDSENKDSISTENREADNAGNTGKSSGQRGVNTVSNHTYKTGDSGSPATWCFGLAGIAGAMLIGCIAYDLQLRHKETELLYNENW